MVISERSKPRDAGDNTKEGQPFRNCCHLDQGWHSLPVIPFHVVLTDHIWHSRFAPSLSQNEQQCVGQQTFQDFGLSRNQIAMHGCLSFLSVFSA
jgi:hypothetical protein